MASPSVRGSKSFAQPLRTLRSFPVSCRVMSLSAQWAQVRRPSDAVAWQPKVLLPLLILFGVAKLLLQTGVTLLSVHAGYGMFRDEFYYIVCGQRLAAGYVDQPPLVALQALATDVVFGHGNLLLFRLLPSFAGVVMVVLTGLLAHALGGRRRAAGMAMLAVLTVPVFVATQSFVSMNAWEPVFWMTCVLALIRLMTSPARPMGWWVLLGASAGLALENKASAVFFLVTLVIAIAATPERRLLRQRGFAVAVGIVALLALPNLLWQVHNGYPTWQWLRAVQHSNKDVVLSPARFLLAQFLMLSPLHLLVWLPGLVWLLRVPRWRTAGLLVVFFVTLMLAMHAKDYYVAPIYPLLFAAGGMLWAAWMDHARPRLLLVSGYCFAMVLALAVTLPFAVPILSPRDYVRYSKLTHFAPIESEQHEATPLPEFFADFLGWPELANAVSATYNALPPAERQQTGIFAANYGEASAITVLGAPSGLPAAISGHQNFWMWGPGRFTGREMIVVTTESLAAMQTRFGTCTVKDFQDSKYWMPWERRYIYLCHNRVTPYAADWGALRIYR